MVAVVFVDKLYCVEPDQKYTPIKINKRTPSSPTSLCVFLYIYFKKYYLPFSIFIFWRITITFPSLPPGNCEGEAPEEEERIVLGPSFQGRAKFVAAGYLRTQQCRYEPVILKCIWVPPLSSLPPPLRVLSDNGWLSVRLATVASCHPSRKTPREDLRSRLTLPFLSAGTAEYPRSQDTVYFCVLFMSF